MGALVWKIQLIKAMIYDTLSQLSSSFIQRMRHYVFVCEFASRCAIYPKTFINLESHLFYTTGTAFVCRSLINETPKVRQLWSSHEYGQPIKSVRRSHMQNNEREVCSVSIPSERRKKNGKEMANTLYFMTINLFDKFFLSFLQNVWVSTMCPVLTAAAAAATAGGVSCVLHFSSFIFFLFLNRCDSTAYIYYIDNQSLSTQIEYTKPDMPTSQLHLLLLLNLV